MAAADDESSAAAAGQAKAGATRAIETGWLHVTPSRQVREVTASARIPLDAPVPPEPPVLPSVGGSEPLQAIAMTSPRPATRRSVFIRPERAKAGPPVNFAPISPSSTCESATSASGIGRRSQGGAKRRVEKTSECVSPPRAVPQRSAARAEQIRAPTREDLFEHGGDTRSGVPSTKSERNPLHDPLRSCSAGAGPGVQAVDFGAVFFHDHLALHAHFGRELAARFGRSPGRMAKRLTLSKEASPALRPSISF